MRSPEFGHRGPAWPAHLHLLAVLLLAGLPAAAQTITEFPLPQAAHGPGGIVTGPDGALWFTGAKQIGRLTPDGTFTAFPFPPDIDSPNDIAVGPDGAFWFTVCGVYLHEPVSGGSKVGRMTQDGRISAFALPLATSCPRGIVAGPDGNLWFTENTTGKIGRITTAGVVTEFAVPSRGLPESITAGADGHLWFSYSATLPLNRYSIGRVSTAGAIVEFGLSSDHIHCPHELTIGPDGLVWFVEGCTFGGAVARITPSGTVTEFPVPTPAAWPQGITTGPDGALWFTEQSGNKIGRMTTDGVFTEYPLPRFASPSGITVGPDDAIWFTEGGANRIGRITVPGFGPPSVTLAPAELSLAVGESRGITASLSRALATDTRLTLTTSEAGVVLLPPEVVIPAGGTSAPFAVIGLSAGATQVSASLADGAGSASVAVRVSAPDTLASLFRLVPIVLDVTTAAAHYTTELALTNTTSSPLSVLLTYTASLGSREGSGTVWTRLDAGEQRVIADAIADLRARGLAIPAPTTGPQGGTLLVAFYGERELGGTSAGVLARTTAATVDPQPVGSAGLAYVGIAPEEAIADSAMLFGLRVTASDRSNVALFNTGSVPVSVRVTLAPGEGTGPGVTFREAETLPRYGWVQYNSSDILGVAGLSNAYVKMERVSAEGSFGAYAVVNDNTTNDGSFLALVKESAEGSALTVPVLVETPSLRSELVLSNCGTATATLQMRYVESLTPELGPGGTTTIELPAGRQLIVPEAVDYLRSRSMAIGGRNRAAYAGSLRISVTGVPLADVFAAARTAWQSPAGGQFGLFTPAVYEGEEASSRAVLLGLRDDAVSRSNAAVLNAGPADAGSVTLSLQAYDGEAGGLRRGEPEVVTLSPGGWKQWSKLLDSKGVRSGWVEVTRIAGTAPWIAYGVINDGAWAGERTGDGAYVPMVVAARGPSAPAAE